MPYKSGYRKKKRAYGRRKRRYTKRRTVAIPRQRFAITNATTRIRTNALFRFTIKYHFEVHTDPGRIAVLTFRANNPFAPYVGKQYCQAISQDHVNAMGSHPPGLAELVAANGDNTYESARYRHGYVAGSRITVAAVPQQRSGSTSDSYQDYFGVVLHKETNAMSEWVNTPGDVDQIRNNFNALTQTPFTKAAVCKQNPNGTPRGVNMAMGYSFKRMNGSGYTDDRNRFTADNPPGEKDYFRIALVPFKIKNDQNSAFDATPIAPTDVHVSMSFVCLLGQPQTMDPTPQPLGDISGRAAKRIRAG